MPKWLIWVLIGLAGSCLICVGGGAAIGWFGFKEYTAATGEASAAAEKIIPPIIKNWDSKALQQHGTPQLISENSPAKFDETMKTLKGLFGDYQSHGGWQANGVSAQSNSNEGTYTSVKLRSQGSFTKRPGIISVELRRFKGSEEWKIQSLYVREPSGAAE